MFSVLADEGILSPEVGRCFRVEVLAMGHRRDAFEHPRAFFGREPSSDVFLADLDLNPAK
ncbi:MAG: Zn-dependent oligopeptidase [bacterium]|nr:Zn-dependent oligopeptidase [bacterium]